ncbi:MAG: hypothetical protein IPK17_38220 [Chloroflexi bacterium]|uniref:hypothetical protein n=1 Tax=Candidatus Flexifilum breve TaxID=3140694 RepID=UPI003136BBB1|nr:hypothetical protein [Chloroflexota bacterium]
MGNLRGGVHTAYVNELAERLNFDLTKRMPYLFDGEQAQARLDPRADGQARPCSFSTSRRAGWIRSCSRLSTN